MRHKINGMRTHCFTGVKKEVQLECELIKWDWPASSARTVFQVYGGPTGYESFQVNPESLEETSTGGWCACNGTPGRWDMLFIPPDQMKKAFEEEECLQHQ